jgi:hypothetical protein
LSTSDPAQKLVSSSALAETRFDKLTVHREGGLGVVCRATDTSLNREVAIKIIKAHLLNDAEAIQQFELEVEITGRLVHPGIAPVYARGKTVDGSPFYAMQFVEGRDFSEEIDAFFSQSETHFDGVPFSRLILAFISVCKTIAYAHSRGVIHRDIKPQNIRIGKFNEVFVLDWGLATPVQRTSHYHFSSESTLAIDRPASGTSRSGGTPAYMSPEQISGLNLTQASDIYSLGATLYKVLTGKSLADATSGKDLNESIMEGRFQPPSELQPSLPKQLEAICLKALAVQPTSRYQTAMELADDLELYMSGSAVSCYLETPYERCGRWLRKNQAWARHIAFGLVVIAIASAVVAALTYQLATNSDEQRKQAELRGEEAAVAREQAERAKLQSLALAAQLGARSIASEIELRGAMMREEAAAPTLRKLVSQLNANPLDKVAQQELDSWIKSRFLQRVTESMPTSSWAIQNRSGVQMARAATRDADTSRFSIGKSFRHRDYFHGNGNDFKPGSDDELKAVPHRFDVHVSSVFVSTNTLKMSVAFSSPIYADDDQGDNHDVIGIIASTVVLDKLDLLPGSILVDLRENKIDEQVHQGMVLRHQKMDESSGGRPSPRNLSSGDLLKVRDTVTQANSAIKSLGSSQLKPVISIVDPVEGKPTQVAVAAVVLANQPDHSRVGWAILMQDAEQP